MALIWAATLWPSVPVGTQAPRCRHCGKLGGDFAAPLLQTARGPYPRSLYSTRSPLGQVAPVLFPAASAMSVGCCHEKRWRCRAVALAAAPASECGCRVLSSPLHPLLHGPLRAMSAQQCSTAASSLVPAGWCSPAAALMPGACWLLAAWLLGHRLLSAPYLKALAPPRYFVSECVALCSL